MSRIEKVTGFKFNGKLYVREKEAIEAMKRRDLGLLFNNLNSTEIIQALAINKNEICLQLKDILYPDIDIQMDAIGYEESEIQ